MKLASEPFGRGFDGKLIVGLAFVARVIESSKTTPDKIRSVGLTRLVTDLQFIVESSIPGIFLISGIARLDTQDMGASSPAAMLVKREGVERRPANRPPLTTLKQSSTKARRSF
jgi:hypothetical protein